METAPSWSKPWEGLKEASLHLPAILVLKSLRNCFAAFLFSVLMYMAMGRVSGRAGVGVLFLVVVPLPFGVPKRMRTGIQTSGP